MMDNDLPASLIRNESMQLRAITLLSTLLRKGTVPHALLFTGMEGVGKQSVAMMFAMACNCPDVTAQFPVVSGPSHKASIKHQASNLYPCGVCRSCRKIQSGNHPDISLIEPSGAFIKIDQIRTLCHTLGMKPYEAEMRVVIIINAQAMNPESGNALLKVLEEPPDRTVLILTAIQTSDLLSTIVSRCQHIRFDPISREKLEYLLVREQGLDPNDAGIISVLANGSYAGALSMIRTNWIKRRNWLINELESLIVGDASTQFPIARLLGFAEKLSKNKDTLPDSLEVMKTWLRDLIICKLVPDSDRRYDPERIINRDLTDRIQHISQNIMAEPLLSKIKAIQSAQKKLRSNANVRLTLEALLMRLAQ
ncbi:MAG: DNA polymerase III subunit delta' [Deltaproteobacteria bacterium]|nr:MAG: DNA polymerase III subunit delta' [Deltaproteobacteria bacterium]